jgi:hypothetical protein
MKGEKKSSQFSLEGLAVPNYPLVPNHDHIQKNRAYRPLIVRIPLEIYTEKRYMKMGRLILFLVNLKFFHSNC